MACRQVTERDKEWQQSGAIACPLDTCASAMVWAEREEQRVTQNTLRTLASLAVLRIKMCN